MDRVEAVEFCNWQYLPVKMADGLSVRLPDNLRHLTPLVKKAIQREGGAFGKYAYLTAKRAWASPGYPLNRPGWHCDGFNTNDINYIWWHGRGTRFAVQNWDDISTDHNRSMEQFEEQFNPLQEHAYPERCLYRLTPFVVHNTPEILVGGMRSFVKVSISTERYNLLGNNHNHLFDYDWTMHDRSVVRNHPVYGGSDYIPEGST
jgi:hypothetical protein